MGLGEVYEDVKGRLGDCDDLEEERDVRCVMIDNEGQDERDEDERDEVAEQEDGGPDKEQLGCGRPDHDGLA